MVDQSPRFDLLRDPPLSKYCGNGQVAIVYVLLSQKPDQRLKKVLAVGFLSFNSGLGHEIAILIGVFAATRIVNEFAKVIRNPSKGENFVSRYREIKRTTAELVGVRVVRRASTAKAHAGIRDVIVANPGLSYQRIADLLGCSRWLVYQCAVEFNVRRPRGAGSSARGKAEQ